MPFDGVREDPRPYIRRRAGIEEVAFLDAMLGEGWEPPVIDLHEPGVAGAVGILTYCLGVHVGFDFRDRPEQRKVDMVMGSRFGHTTIHAAVGYGAATRQQHRQRDQYGQPTYERWEFDQAHVRGTGTLALPGHAQKWRLV